ncbi:hypothetical protein MLD38_008559 [Melastoma candidum]|uniref:Uncharacterized protein n=1 Tax=Melastoma candidum TaxID=119954 RepID=A0ACB9RUE5_9MYRT|nr:hypothetical protein MLD38_008559 [Melastoma candidum]
MALLQNCVVGSPVLAWEDSTTLTVVRSTKLAAMSGGVETMIKRRSTIIQKVDVFSVAKSIREHVRLSPKISDAVKGKLSLGARILQVGGMQKVFKHLFDVTENERLVKASQCYLSTTAGPIAGVLFISSEKIAFCSERTIKLSCPNRKSIRLHYKVAIPLAKIQTVNPGENTKRPSQKFMQIVTVDNFDFWFMGFLNHQKSFECLQQAIYQL